LMLPSDCYSNGQVQGGVVLKLMDNAAGVVAARHCRSNVVTVNIDAVNFRANEDCAASPMGTCPARGLPHVCCVPRALCYMPHAVCRMLSVALSARNSSNCMPKSCNQLVLRISRSCGQWLWTAVRDAASAADAS